MEGKLDPKLMTKEMLSKAMACETPEAIIALAKENGIELTAEEGKRIFENLENFDVNLADDALEKVAGGSSDEICWEICHSPGTY